MGTGRLVDISARGIAGDTWPGRREGSSDGARRIPTCGGGGSRSGTSSGRRQPRTELQQSGTLDIVKDVDCFIQTVSYTTKRIYN